MKIKVLLIISLFVLLPSIAFSSLTGEIRLSLVEGDVQVRPEGTDEWFPASINAPLLDGDRLWVPDRGRLEIQSRDGSFIRLNENSALDVLRMENDSHQYYLNSGSIYVNFAGRKRYLQIDTPGASIRVYDRAKFRVDVFEDGRIEVSTYSGQVYVESASGRTAVRAGNMLSMRDREYAELLPLGPSDEWERWNRDRDRRYLEKRYSYRYLPDELRPYSYDFDENGRWVYVREYGYVWTPTVIVSVGWAPYRYGRWVWIRGDYVWISYEPWGWVPYHYGRWAFVASIGWCWVPPARGAVYWGPGFVGWVYGPDYVAWVPLAPGEIYYGYGYYGPHSVNIINIDIHKVVIKEYKHAHIRDAITIVHRETFLRGKPVEVKVRENPFLTQKIHIGRPPIEPVRETRAPIIKELIRGKEPPQRIRELDLKRLREHRPIVKEKDISVMRPGEKLREFPPERLKKTLRPGDRVIIDRQKDLNENSEKPGDILKKRFKPPAKPEERIKEKEMRPFDRRQDDLPLRPLRPEDKIRSGGDNRPLPRGNQNESSKLMQKLKERGKGHDGPSTQRPDLRPPDRPFEVKKGIENKKARGFKDRDTTEPQDNEKEENELLKRLRGR